MKRMPSISDAEWVVMKVLWRRSPLTAGEVIEALAGEVDWQPKTVKTLLNRLLKKKALGFRREGRAYLYYPLVDESAAARAESRSFLERVYDGALTPMVASILEDEDVSDEEIARLRRLLDERRRKR